ncbi:hypothetical protein [Halomonas sp. JS92-SW72]|uniref:hypothetical protein n=1 Tax=Halomonas sp. JS92-SW72 TaxID=2306583 RepID=UPI0013C2B796|nr:hypothetical protein [Halomonas sp. JS92-SW72]
MAAKWLEILAFSFNMDGEKGGAPVMGDSEKVGGARKKVTWVAGLFFIYKPMILNAFAVTFKRSQKVLKKVMPT